MTALSGLVLRDGSPPSRLGERTAFAGASATTLLGGLGLLGWVTPWRWLASISPASIPMAPRTAVALVLLGATLMLDARRRSPRLTTAVSLFVFIFTGLQLVRFVAGLPPTLDSVLVRHPDLFGGVPTGQMSPWTAFGLVLASLSLLLASLSLLFIGLARGHRAFGATAGGLALAVCLLGIVVTLGYLFGAPLLYGSPVVPMAFPTALAVACLGLALVGLAPRDSAPLRWFTGSSARAKLLRAFLPVAPAIVVGELVFAQVEGLNPALHVALTALLSASVVAVVVSYAAQGVSRELDRAQAERECSRRDADRLAAIVQSSADAIYVKSLDGTIVAWNASAERLFGYAPDEILGRSAKILVPPGEDELTAILKKISAGERIEHKETNRVRKDGSPVLVSLSESPLRDADGRVVGVSAIARDLSEQRRAETALLESEGRFREIAERIREVFWVTDPAKTRMLYISPAYEEMWGRTCASLYENPMSFVEAIHPDARERVLARMAGQASGEYDEVYRILRPDGSLRWIHDRAFPVHGPDGRLLRVVGSAQDITELKQTEQALRESEGRYRSLFEGAPDGILVADSKGTYVDVNPRALDMLGYSRDEFIGMESADILVPKEHSRLESALTEINQGVEHRHEWQFRRKDGSGFHADVMATVMADGRILALVRDSSERRRMEAQLRQSQKMEAVGRLAGGVAHDFNNSLGVILGYTELLMRQAGEAQRGKLEQILKATHRASGLTRQLLAFSRKQIVDPKVLDLNALLSDLEKMLGRLIGEHIDFAIVPGADLGQVKADPGQLEQVVMNLCVNARDAMPDGGLLRIETANVRLDAGQGTQHEPMAAGRYVMLAVSDTGCGIEKEVVSKIFEPFFTTKEQGKGTGLGLAMVYGIVKQAGGYVWVYSELERGTTLKVYLPRIDEAAPAPAVLETAMPSKGWETVLLVEDEGPLREIAREILEEHGYLVIEATSPNEAIEIFHRYVEPIHLLLTDVVMPGMNGRALAERLVAERPALGVLYMSGYTDDVIAHRGVLEPGTLFLEKPFTALALLERVRVALGERGARESA